MDNFEIFLLLLWGLFFFFILFSLIKYIKHKKHLQKLKQTPLNEEFKKYIINLPLYKGLNDSQKKIIEYKIQRFIEEKEFFWKYMEENIEAKILISFFGCILTIGYEEYCYDNLKYIFVYPNTVIKKEKINEILISGEAIYDTVIICWNEAKREIYHNKKRNVIVHEFAHILDFDADGIADGIPVTSNMIKEWKKYILGEYKKLLKHKEELFIDSYALSNEAEFFAVISEYFFTSPSTLKIHYENLYNELVKFYKIDTYKILKNF